MIDKINLWYATTDKLRGIKALYFESLVKMGANGAELEKYLKEYEYSSSECWYEMDKEWFEKQNQSNLVDELLAERIKRIDRELEGLEEVKRQNEEKKKGLEESNAAFPELERTLTT